MVRPPPDAAVEVIYATAERQQIVSVPYEAGLTAERAVKLSGLADTFPAINAEPLILGVFGVQVLRQHVLAPGDRVEICRPLLRDPRDRRRVLALKKPGKE